jgi:lariat debranching enzyme
MPLDGGAVRSIYHIREYNVRRLSLLTRPDMMLSHDWPARITAHGDAARLVRAKPFFAPDLARGQLGSPPLDGLLAALRPAWWFAAHLHVRFEARVDHAPDEVKNPDEIAIEDDAPAVAAAAANPDEIVLNDADDEEPPTPAAAPAPPTDPIEGVLSEAAPASAVPRVNPDEILLSDEEAEVEVAAPPPPPPPRRAAPPPAHRGHRVEGGVLLTDGGAATRFLALDKCLPRRDFLEVRAPALLPHPR